MFCPKCGKQINDVSKFCRYCGTTLSKGSFGTMPPSSIAKPSSVNTDSERPYAGFWIRVGAYCIDMVVMIIPGGIVNLLLRSQMSLYNDVPQFYTEVMLFGYGLLVGWMYSAVLESSSWQATFGKKAVGIKVTDLDGQRISLGRATGRWLSKIIASLSLGIGFMMVGWTERKQGLHDKMANTLVVKQR